MEAKRTAMVGGSFDPVHRGHLHLIHTVLTRTDFRRFVFVPVAVNNFKREHVPAPAVDRLSMLRLAVAAYPVLYPDDPEREIIVDDCEIRRGGVSYTVDTAKDLSNRYPLLGRLGVVLGDDLLSGLEGWRAYRTLRDLVTFVVIRRSPRGIIFPTDGKADVRFVGGDVYHDSSSEIRDELAALASEEPMPPSVRSMMVKEVADYVETHRLYRVTDGNL
ncbi:MAG: nicotinate-nicotinamide nucleotide adenylyltransferase [Sphaerochaetaceae bacterium]